MDLCEGSIIPVTTVIKWNVTGGGGRGGGGCCGGCCVYLLMGVVCTH